MERSFFARHCVAVLIIMAMVAALVCGLYYRGWKERERQITETMKKYQAWQPLDIIRFPHPGRYHPTQQTLSDIATAERISRETGRPVSAIDVIRMRATGHDMVPGGSYIVPTTP
jgi:hypothetical protein